jgi:hypothetical protein
MVRGLSAAARVAVALEGQALWENKQGLREVHGCGSLPATPSRLCCWLCLMTSHARL